MNHSIPTQKNAALSIQSVVKDFPKLRALNGVSLNIEQGEFFGLLGPNGAGKTTLISIIAGLAKASSGSVSVMGHDTQNDFRWAWFHRSWCLIHFLRSKNVCAIKAAITV
jgi:ABC-type multidrug transport system ATPase subunit